MVLGGFGWFRVLVTTKTINDDHLGHGASNDQKSFPRVDSSVPLIHHDPNDLESMIHFWILQKKNAPLYYTWLFT